MRRRSFLTLLGSAAVWPMLWPLATRAQPSAIPTVGWLDITTQAARAGRFSAFRQGLSQAGFDEGRNVAIESRWADDAFDRLPALAADLVRRQVAVIVAAGPAVPAAKDATATIPIVFITGGDPIDSGLVASLSRPAGNVTGVSFFSTALYAKRLELLHELVPKTVLIGAIVDPNVSQSDDSVQELEQAAKALGRQIVIARAASESDFDSAFATIVQAGAGALFVGAGPLYISQRRQLVILAARYALPASYSARTYAEVGGLMSYGADDIDAGRRAGINVGRILKGAKPSELPVELPTKYEFVINLKTAKEFKLDIPARLLALADEVIE